LNLDQLSEVKAIIDREATWHKENKDIGTSGYNDGEKEAFVDGMDHILAVFDLIEHKMKGGS